MPRNAGFDPLDDRVKYYRKGQPDQNFGDFLTELFCQELFAFPKVDADSYRLVGSVIDETLIRNELQQINGQVSGLAVYWCCGARTDAGISDELREHCLFLGVRGPLTRAALGLPDDTPLGDPGLLAPLFHTPRPAPEFEGKTVCMKHVLDPRPDGELLEMSGADVILSPQVGANPQALRGLLDKLAAAEFVLSASLHGAIIAFAYGRKFCFWDNGHLDVPFKWDDFAASIGVAAPFAKTLAEAQALVGRADFRPVAPPLLPLLLAAPYTIRAAAMARALDLWTDGEDERQQAEALQCKAEAAQVRQFAKLSRRNREERGDLIKQMVGTGLRSMRSLKRNLAGRPAS